MREELLKFIRMKSPDKTVLDIIALEETDEDDVENRKHIVTCKLRYINPTSPTGILDSREEKCLVDIEEFKRFLKAEKAVIWIDDEEM